MEGPEAGGTVSPEEDFSFVSPIVKFVLFFFNMLFWFSICLAIIFLLQLVAGVLGFVFSDKARGKVSEIINGAIMHYRDDLDLQNLIDFGQKEFSCCGGISYKDWSQNMYFNCTMDNPSRERCSVPFSCCLPDDDEVRLVSSWGICSSSSILWMGAQKRQGLPRSSWVRFLSRLSSTPCVDMAYRPWATWRPALSSTPMAASTAWSTGSTGTSSCWGALRWGWQPHSWWASCWLRSSSTRSETRSSCSSTTSSTGQTPCTDPGASQRLSPPGLPNPGSIGRAEGTLLEKRKVGAVDAGSVHCGHTWLGRSKLPCAVWGTKLLSVCLSWGTPSWCADCA
ncbi:tetraspanin-33 isoform X3 [Lathamus discolor]|uniref:tetraspanin-33 isoform X3 n=1 Tax=Lathamus discolor TaxID=678569 RepID=UPI0032B78FB1